MRQFVLFVALAFAADAYAQEPAKKSAGPRKNPRVECGCPSARLLHRGAAVLDDGVSVGAWLHDGARLEVFAQDEVNKQKLHAVDAPIVVEEFPLPSVIADDAAVATTSRLVRARATAAIAPATYLGVLRKTDVAPRDVVAVSGAGGAQDAHDGAPALKALWLAPLEERERPGCGAYITHRIAFELAGGAPVAPDAAPVAPEAFLVRDTRTKQAALVDARYAGVFGLGRVDVCEQGLAFAPGEPTQIEVRPVSSRFGVGEPWTFASDGTGQTDPTRVASPASADAALIEQPFPVPGALAVDDWTFKQIAITVMGSVVGGAAVFALVFWVIIPARRRRMKDFPCPSCGKAIPVDTLDKQTDGFFCPACGKSGYWKGEVKSL